MVTINKVVLINFSAFCAAVFLLQACSFSDKATQQYYEKASSESYEMIAVPGVPFTEAGWDSTMKARVTGPNIYTIKGLLKISCFQGHRLAALITKEK